MEERKSDRTEDLTNLFTKGLVDISNTGLAMQLEKNFNLGEIIHFKLQSTSQTLTVRGKVMRNIQKGKNLFLIGTHFVYLKDEEKATIETMVDDYGKGVPIQVEILAK